VVAGATHLTVLVRWTSYYAHTTLPINTKDARIHTNLWLHSARLDDLKSTVTADSKTSADLPKLYSSDSIMRQVSYFDEHRSHSHHSAPASHTNLQDQSDTGLLKNDSASASSTGPAVIDSLLQINLYSKLCAPSTRPFQPHSLKGLSTST
jgi:hypothetical protein